MTDGNVGHLFLPIAAHWLVSGGDVDDDGGDDDYYDGDGHGDGDYGSKFTRNFDKVTVTRK